MNKMISAAYGRTGIIAGSKFLGEMPSAVLVLMAVLCVWGGGRE